MCIQNFHARICVHSAGVGGKEADSFTPAHRHRKHNKLNTHTQSRDKWETKLQATMKELKCLESRPERMNSLSPWCSWAGYSTGKERYIYIYLKDSWPYSFVLRSLGPGTSSNDSLDNRRERDGVYGGTNSERSRLPAAEFYQQNNTWQKAGYGVGPIW